MKIEMNSLIKIYHNRNKGIYFFDLQSPPIFRTNFFISEENNQKKGPPKDENCIFPFRNFEDEFQNLKYRHFIIMIEKKIAMETPENENDINFDTNDELFNCLENLFKNRSGETDRTKFEEKDVPHCIIYYEDDIKISIDNQILNELIYQFKYNKSYLDKFYKGKFDLIEKKILEKDFINALNLPFLHKINDFLNLLKTEEIKIKRLVNKHYVFNSLDNDNKIKKLAKKFIEQFEGVSLFKNNKLKIIETFLI
jgi:hypothetical protein